MSLFINSWVNMPQHILFSLGKIKFAVFHVIFFAAKLLLPPAQRIYFYL